jgi:O-antigen biosynthesis protein
VRILVVTNQLGNRAGSELFTVNLCQELIKRQIEVAVYAPFLGAIGALIRDKGILVTDKPDDLSTFTFDAIHAQHNIPAIIARSLFPSTPMILMVHSGIEALEQPPSIPLGISRYVAVSERIKYHLMRDCAIDERSIDIVRSFIDIDMFYSTTPLNTYPRRLLVLSNHYIDHVRSVISTACRDLNIYVFHAGLPHNPVHNVAEWINRSDIVVTLGRGVLEAAACERNIIVYDHFGADGFVTPDNFAFLRQRSFCGMTHSIQYTADDFRDELLKYNPQIGPALRECVMKEYTASDNVDRLISIYHEAIRNNAASHSVITHGQLLNEFQHLISLAAVKKRTRFTKRLKLALRNRWHRFANLYLH